MAGTDIETTAVFNDEAVRKWALQVLCFYAPDAELPTAADESAWFDETDHLPIVPAGGKQAGFFTTDGTEYEASIDGDKTTMLQSLEPVRHDLTGIEKTIKVTPGEVNSYVECLQQGIPFEDWPDAPDGPFIFHEGEVSEFPYYRAVLFKKDGVGENAFYRVEAMYRVKVESVGSRKANRSDTDTAELTLGLYRDKALKRSRTIAQSGPAYFKVTTP